ncbi:MAG TPA: 3,4-dihydroxy-2-butanone-4-phosphate synthase, partial [Roseococcus sp.]|nr:3,4-dihydroxy-2-butanone-4-phosphate synthase [Roseococcus sp.]
AVEPGEHMALVKGRLDAPGPVLTRMHACHLINDLVTDRGNQELQAAMEAIAAEGRGVVVLLRDWRPDGLSAQLRSQREKTDAPQLRDYGIGAQILADLGLHDIIRLSNNPRLVVGLEGWGLRVVETRPLAQTPRA